MAKQLKVLGLSSAERLSDEVLLTEFVNALIEALGMRPLCEPLIANVPLEVEKLGAVPFEDEGGISVIRMLSTSHIAIHCFPLRHEFYLDIYSCREFNTQWIAKVLDDYLLPRRIQITDLTYACEWNVWETSLEQRDTMLTRDSAKNQRVKT